VANNPMLAGATGDNSAISHTEAIINSMTAKEREDPDLINPSRRRRLAAGSGLAVEEVNRMIKQFNQMKDMMHSFTTGGGGLPPEMASMMDGIDMEGLASQAQGGEGMPDLSELMGGGIGGRIANFAVKRQVRNIQKAKKKRIKKRK
jgi:signal recognition particle subunit SRP54